VKIGDRRWHGGHFNIPHNFACLEKAASQYTKLRGGSLLRLLVLMLSLFLCAGCNTLKQMNSNLEQSNQNLAQNTATVEKSSNVIHSNTKEIARSTDTMTVFALIFLAGFIFLLIILSYPAVKIFRLHREIKHLLHNLLHRK
jgi:hypothetical protein